MCEEVKKQFFIFYVETIRAPLIEQKSLDIEAKEVENIKVGILSNKA